jgi:hypothetical protein
MGNNSKGPENVIGLLRLYICLGKIYFYFSFQIILIGKLQRNYPRNTILV